MLIGTTIYAPYLCVCSIPAEGFLSVYLTERKVIKVKQNKIVARIEEAYFITTLPFCNYMQQLILKNPRC